MKLKRLLASKRAARLGQWSMRLLALVGFLTVLVVGTPAVTWLIPPPAGSFEVPSGDTLVVLGSGTFGDLPSFDTYWRSVSAMRLYQAGAIQRIVVSGGVPRPGAKPVAEVMAEFLRGWGIAPDKILLETSSRSTRENALYVARLLRSVPAGRVVLLTSDFHASRAAAAFARVGIPVKVAAVPYVANIGKDPVLRPLLLRTLLVEAAKHVWYRLHGWI